MCSQQVITDNKETFIRQLKVVGKGYISAEPDLVTFNLQCRVKGEGIREEYPGP